MALRLSKNGHTKAPIDNITIEKIRLFNEPVLSATFPKIILPQIEASPISDSAKEDCDSLNLFPSICGTMCTNMFKKEKL